MSVSEALATPVDEIMDSMELAPRNGFHLEPRCRVCRNDRLRRKVNDLLATGSSYAMIVRALEGDNATLDKRDRVTIDSVRNHCTRHFPVQNVAQATYREILEQRAQENGVDFVDALGTAITPLAFLHVVMARAYETLVDPGTKVEVSTGIVAAGRLQALLDSRAGQPDLTRIKAQVYQIVEAVKATVPQAMWADILDKLDLDDRPVRAESDDYDNEDEAFDPDGIDGEFEMTGEAYR